jgi:hypothetical protein
VAAVAGIDQLTDPQPRLDVIEGVREPNATRSPSCRRAQAGGHLAELESILARTRLGALDEESFATLRGAVDTLAIVTAELEKKNASIRYLRSLLFGGSSEKSKDVLAGHASKKESATTSSSPPAREKKKGHGRNGADAYPRAEKVLVPHPEITHGQRCKLCERGRIYRMKKPSRLVRVRGMAPLMATVYECDQLRCNGCQQVFTAPPPDGVGDEKYDASATAMVGILRYGTGMPFNRLEQLQNAMGMPVPAATQWDLVKAGAEKLAAVFDELVDQAAQSEVAHNDDTYMPVVQLMNAETRPKDDRIDEDRTGMFTTAVVAERGEHRVALYFTGVKHAGENLEQVLAQRRADLPPIIQMCDALARNAPGEIETRLGACSTHARRHFVEQLDNFPDECAHVIETFRALYKSEAKTRNDKMSDDDRLLYHQKHSGPLMQDLEEWMKNKLDNKEVEPNSGLGKAMRYALTHWAKLTLFLRVPGVPIDNNICERALKMAIRHRRNSLLYRTMNGARVGDTWMSLIHTAQLEGVDPFAYLTCLLRHHEDVEAAAAAWLPWRYEKTAREPPPP